MIAALGSSALAWAVFAALALASPRSMGWGDVKLVGLLTLVTGLFGPAVALAGVLLAFVLGGMAALALVLRRKAGAGTPLAFGPWLLAGACVVMAGAAFGTA